MTTKKAIPLRSSQSASSLSSSLSSSFAMISSLAIILMMLLPQHGTHAASSSSSSSSSPAAAAFQVAGSGWVVPRKLSVSAGTRNKIPLHHNTRQTALKRTIANFMAETTSASTSTDVESEADVVETNKSGGGRRKSVFRPTLRRIFDSITNKQRSEDELRIGIAGFYDRSSKLWEEVWGEHMHHGYYVPENRTDHVQAQVDLIDEVLKWADVGVEKMDGTKAFVPANVVDVGCGIGGSSRHIANKYECKCQGITLSPYQANRGNELALEQKLQDRCSFRVADALDMPFDDESYDMVWSLESGEHMPNKAKFVNELFRVTKPGGKIILVTWCHRDLSPGETSLEPWEEKLLRKINRAYYLPEWCSVQDYVDLFATHDAVDVKREDWSYIIAPFWKAVIQSSLNLRSVWGLLKSGFSTQRGAYAMFLMLQGYRKGLIKFGLLTCNKPLTTARSTGTKTSASEEKLP